MRAARFLLGVIGLLAIIAAAAYALRLPLAGFAVRSAMAGAGLENPRAQVTALSMNHVVLRDVAAGPAGGEGFAIEEIEASYDWRSVLAERAADEVRIGPGVLRIAVSPAGEVSLPGFSFEERGGGSDMSLPFSKLTIADLAFIVNTPEGAARGTMSADYDEAAGGSAKLSLATDIAGFQAMRMERGAVEVGIDLGTDDSVMAHGMFTGEAFTSYGAIRDVEIAFETALQSWRDAAGDGLKKMVGDARVEVTSATVNLAEVPSTSAMNSDQSAVLFGGPVSSLQLSGALDLTAAGGEISAGLGGQPLIVRADNGAQLSVTELDGERLYRRSDSGQEASLSFDVSGAGIAINGTIDAETIQDGWFILAPIRVGDYRSDRVSFEDASAVVRLTTQPNGVSADITTTSALRALSIGRMSVFDAPVETNFLIETNHAAKTATVSLPRGGCVTLQSARITIDQQDTEAALKDARLCESEGPLGVVDWSGALQSRFAGNLSTDRLQYRLGQTTIAGRSPVIEFAGLYQPALHLTTIDGDITGGALLLNDMLIFSEADGDFDFELNQQLMSSSVRADAVRIAQNLKTPMVAPVIGAGALQLTGKDVDFDYVLKTPAGEQLGAGSGEHNVATARGRSTFTFDRIEYQPEGIQPDQLAPVLQGVIGQTSGATTGEALFEWAPDPVGLSSSASLSFEDITFAGPTRVVTQTIGVNGRLNLASLWPVKTDGVQTITVSGVDFGALQIDEEGEIRFDMPGDETLLIERAEFPWFGGLLGVYGASASISGGEAVAPLRAENIDLSLILDYVDMDGLSGEGILSGVLPLVVKDGKASIENGMLQSDGPGAIRYQGQAGEEAAAVGEQAQIAFDLLRDLRYADLGVTIDGPLDGRLQFQLKFEGTGEVALNQQNVRVPVIYRISLDAALLELLNQANLSQSIQLQIEEGLQDRE